MWGLVLRRDGECGDGERVEALRFFLVGEGLLLDEKMKQPKWMRRRKRERNLLKNVPMLTVVVAIDV